MIKQDFFGKDTTVMKNHQTVKDTYKRKVWCSFQEKSVDILVS